MRTLRILYRLFRVFSMLYAIWHGSRVTRVVKFCLWLWNIIRRTPRKAKPRVMISFMDPHSPDIYRRQGWRQVGQRRNEER